MVHLSASHAWKAKYPGAVVGMMVVGEIQNTKKSASWLSKKEEIESVLRTRVSSKNALVEHPIIRAYTAYYKNFRKSYHVLLQVESVALKGKPIPNVNPVVTAMFMAELKNFLLTAGHDLDAVEGPVLLDIATGREIYLKFDGGRQALKAGDMMVQDRRGVLSSVIYGPDQRSKITMETKNALFVVYAPPGVPLENVSRHLRDILSFIQLFSPPADRMQTEIFEAS